MQAARGAGLSTFFHTWTWAGRHNSKFVLERSSIQNRRASHTAGGRRTIAPYGLPHAHPFPRHSGGLTPVPGPPLYDGKPPLWARWAYGLVALDILFTTSGIDLILNHWSQQVENADSSDATATSNSSSSSSSNQYELRPIWHRLGLAAFQLVMGAGVAAAILASRDRNVWRVRVLRPIISPTSSSSSAAIANKTQAKRSQPTPSDASEPQSTHSSSFIQLSTASGRTRTYAMQGCSIAVPGSAFTRANTQSEPTASSKDNKKYVEDSLTLHIAGIRGYFHMSLKPGTRVDGVNFTEITTEDGKLSETKHAEEKAHHAGLHSHSTNSAPHPPPTSLKPQSVQHATALLRTRLAKRWNEEGGIVDPSLLQPSGSGASLGWTSGPVLEDQ